MAILLLLIFSSFVIWIGSFYINITKSIPRIGGEYIEGIVGQPLYINPLLSQTSEADSDISQLVFSGLFKFDKAGKVVSDLAEGFVVSDDKREYTISIRKGIVWQDGIKLDANDAFFTFNVLSDAAYKSPLRQSMQGVDISIIDDYTLKFTLKNPYTGFLENLTVGLLPKHIWENIAPEKFALAENNLHPVGSGPYAFSNFQKDSGGNILTLQLAANKNYYDGVPYISKITFNFYPGDEELIAGYNKKEIMGMGSIPPKNVNEIKNSKSTNLRSIAIPSYFAVFFNQTKNAALANDSVRTALDLAIFRQELIDKILYGKGSAIKSPFLPQMPGYKDPGSMQSNIDAAKKILDEGGWVLDEKENIRKKDNIRLEFEIITTDWPELNQTAELLKDQW